MNRPSPERSPALETPPTSSSPTPAAEIPLAVPLSSDHPRARSGACCNPCEPSFVLPLSVGSLLPWNAPHEAHLHAPPRSSSPTRLRPSNGRATVPISFTVTRKCCRTTRRSSTSTAPSFSTSPNSGRRWTRRRRHLRRPRGQPPPPLDAVCFQLPIGVLRRRFGSRSTKPAPHRRVWPRRRLNAGEMDLFDHGFDPLGH